MIRRVEGTSILYQGEKPGSAVTAQLDERFGDQECTIYLRGVIGSEAAEDLGLEIDTLVSLGYRIAVDTAGITRICDTFSDQLLALQARMERLPQGKLPIRNMPEAIYALLRRSGAAYYLDVTLKED